MIDPEGSDSPVPFPSEETAPMLAHFWSTELPGEPLHVSALTPHPEATVALTTWARLYHEIKRFRSRQYASALAVTAEASIAINFPIEGAWVDEEPVTWIEVGISSELKDVVGAVEGRLTTYIKFDLKKPGVVAANDVVITISGETPLATRFTPLLDPEVTEEGLYMAEDASGVTFKRHIYVMGESGATEMVNLLSEATGAGMDILENRFENSLALMTPGLQEACHRFFVLRKNLIYKPEEVFQEVWDWDQPPTQYRDVGEALCGWLPDKFVIYAPPGVMTTDSHEFDDFFDEHSTDWTRISWHRESLPDYFEPLFDKPTEATAISFEEILAEVPPEQHILLARHAAENLYYLASLIRQSDSDPDTAKLRQRYAEEAADYIQYFPEVAAQYPPAVLPPQA